MTTSSDINTLRTQGAGAATAEQAQRAVKAFRALQPTLTAYARNLTGRNDVRVEMAAQDNGSTDGTRIFFRPPIALGVDTKHQRSVCGRRDKKTQLNLCAACDAREDVLVTIYHEIAHIAYESFADVDVADVEAMAAAVEASGGAWGKHVAERMRRAPSYQKRTYIAVSNLTSPFMPLLWNALEDARVNAKMFSARPGTKVMFDSNTKKIFREGVEQVDPATGETIVKMWDEYPANMQVLVGLFCKASGFDYRGWFAPQIERALDDEVLSQIVNRMGTVRSAAGVYNMCLPILTRLRELGFCKMDDEPEEEPDEATPEDPSVEEEPPPSPPEGEDEKQKGEDSDPEADSDDEGDGGQDASDESDVRPGDADSEGQPEEESADAPEEGTDGGDDREGEGGAGDDPEDAEGSDSDPSSAADESGTGDSQDDDGPGSAEPSDGPREGDADVPAEGGAEADPAGSELGDDEDGPVDGSELEDESDESGRGSSDESDEKPGDGPSDEDAGITGTGEEGQDQAVGEGTGGELDADSGSGGEDHATGDADSHGESGGSDMASPGDSDEESDEPGSDAGSDGVGSDTDDADQPGGNAPSVDESGADDEAPGQDDDGDLVDTGADAGHGGTELIEDKSLEDKPLEMGTPEDAKFGLLKFGDHEDKPKTAEEKAGDKAVDVAIVQGMYFETPSRNITGVREHRWGVPHVIGGFNFSQAWDETGFYSIMGRRSGRDSEVEIAESILGPALMRMRVAFADNQRGHNKQHLKSGKVNGRVLGKRAHLGDPRLFRKKTQPGKKNYLVVIGMDVSGSTAGVNIALEKQAVMAQAQLCQRMGIPFAIYAHSGNYWSPTDGRVSGFALDIYIIKEEHEPWDKGTQERLTKLGPDSANLDGHFLEYLRKRADESQATDVVILYYSDGKMPAENHDEELEILQREIKTCDKKGYTLLGVGIRTDSPARHGLDTVQVNAADEVGKVVKHLEKRLLSASAR